MPARLRSIEAAGTAPPAAQPSRVWATLCSIAFMEPRSISWLTSDVGAPKARRQNPRFCPSHF